MEAGAVRHGAECFNFYFPQELDREYLVIYEGFGKARLCQAALTFRSLFLAHIVSALHSIIRHEKHPHSLIKQENSRQYPGYLEIFQQQGLEIYTFQIHLVHPGVARAYFGL